MRTGGKGEVMTTIDRPVRRETATYKRDAGRTRALLVELHPSHIELRCKGTRRRLAVPYDAIYDLACKLLARQAREEKRKARL